LGGLDIRPDDPMKVVGHIGHLQVTKSLRGLY
jgi:hypothetical protein